MRKERKHVRAMVVVPVPPRLPHLRPPSPPLLWPPSTRFATLSAAVSSVFLPLLRALSLLLVSLPLLQTFICPFGPFGPFPFPPPASLSFPACSSAGFSLSSAVLSIFVRLSFTLSLPSLSFLCVFTPAPAFCFFGCRARVPSALGVPCAPNFSFFFYSPLCTAHKPDAPFLSSVLALKATLSRCIQVRRRNKKK